MAPLCPGLAKARLSQTTACFTWTKISRAHLLTEPLGLFVQVASVFFGPLAHAPEGKHDDAADTAPHVEVEVGFCHRLKLQEGNVCGRVGCKTLTTTGYALGLKVLRGLGTYGPAHLGLPKSQEDTTGDMLASDNNSVPSRNALSKALYVLNPPVSKLICAHAVFFVHEFETSHVCLLLTVPQSEILGLTVCRHSFVARSHTFSQKQGMDANYARKS